MTAKSKKSDAGDHSAGSGHYQVVARRYRPRTFDELIGQAPIAQALSNALTSGRVGHAYLFTGARGVGKTSSARIFAKSLNCVQGPTLTPCGVCDSCVNVSIGEDIDVIEIDGASNRGIDEIRQLRQNASICPSRSRFKIYIIDEVHMLTREAFNALLKTLEEPPEHVKFIFCTTEPSKIPITILSRCQRYDFAGIETSQIARRLADIAADEKVTADDDVFPTLARRAAGSMRDAQSLLEQLLSFAPEHITLADVHDMLGTANDQLLFRVMDALIRCEPAAIFTEMETAAGEGVDFGVLVEQMMGLLRDLMVVASGGGADLLLFCSPGQLEDLRKIATAFGLHRILAALQILDATHHRMRYSTQGRVLIELALVRIAHLDHFQMITVLLDKLREGQLPIRISMSEVEPIRSVQRSVAPVAPVGAPLSGNSPGDADGGSSPSPALGAKLEPKPVSEATPDLGDIDPRKAAAIWEEAVDGIRGILGTSASKAIRVSFEAPNVFVVVFDNAAGKEYCERESPQLQNALCRTIGQSVRIRFLLEEAKQQDTAPLRARSKAETGELFQKAAENPVVRQLETLFGAELSEIK